MKGTEVEITEMKNKAEMLIYTLQTNGKNSLNSVVKQATDLFPDFADAIKNAAAEAAKTGNYDILINKLREITNLQAKMMGNAAAQKVYDATAAKAGHEMRTASRSEKRKAGLEELSDYFDSKKIAKEIQEAIYAEIYKMRVMGAKSGDIDSYVKSATGGGAGLSNFNHNMIKGLTSLVGDGRNLVESINKNQADIDAATQAEAEAAAERAKALQDAAAAEDAAAEAAKKSKEKKDKFAQIQTDLENDIAQAEDELKQGFIDNEKYLQKLSEAYKKAYDDYFKLTQKGGELNPYYDKAKTSLAEFTKAAEASAKAEKDAAAKKDAQEHAVETANKAMTHYNESAGAAKTRDPWESYSDNAKEYKKEQVAIEQLREEINRLEAAYQAVTPVVETLGTVGTDEAKNLLKWYEELGKKIPEMKAQMQELQKEFDTKKIKDLRNELNYKVFDNYYSSVKTCTSAIQTFADTVSEIGDAD